MVFVGVVPGRRGALAQISGDMLNVRIDSCPLDASGEHDFVAMSKMARDLPPDAKIVLERPTAGGGSSGYGAWRGIFGCLGVVPSLATREAWRSVMLAGIEGGLEEEVRALGQLLPGHPVDTLVGKSVDRAAALHLAYYARVLWKMGKL